MSLSPHPRLDVPTFTAEQLEPLLTQGNGPVAKLARAQKYSLELLHGLDGTTVTPERLAWIVIWSRSCQLLAAAKTAFLAESQFLISIAFRGATECYLHAQFFVEPVLELNALANAKAMTVRVAPSAESRAREVMKDRLRGYAAWCLREDRKALRAARGTLQDLYDGTDAQELLRDEPHRTFHERFFGPIPTANQHELDRDRQTHADYIDRRLRWIDFWLRDQQLDVWTRRLDDEEQKSGPQSTSFFAALGAEGASIRKRLKHLTIGFVYTTYSEASQMLHGSTVLNFLQISESEVSPHFGQASDPGTLTDGTSDYCLRAIGNLGYLRRHLWTEEDREELS
jgi:hypothetical protein